MKLRYIGTSYLLLKGSQSKRLYRFSASQAILEVEQRDAASMVAHPLLATYK